MASVTCLLPACVPCACAWCWLSYHTGLFPGSVFCPGLVDSLGVGTFYLNCQFTLNLSIYIVSVLCNLPIGGIASSPLVFLHFKCALMFIFFSASYPFCNWVAGQGLSPVWPSWYVARPWVFLMSTEVHYFFLSSHFVFKVLKGPITCLDSSASGAVNISFLLPLLFRLKYFVMPWLLQ